MAFVGCPVVGDEMYDVSGGRDGQLEEATSCTEGKVCMDVEAKNRARTMEAREVRRGHAGMTCKAGGGHLSAAGLPPRPP
eukprot:192908-Hanusia_phi.AAC.4